MTFFVNTLTLECPVYEGRIKFEHGIDQALTYPEYNLPSEYAVVVQAPQPPHNMYTHKVEAVMPPTFINGQWVQGWTLHELTPAEKKLAQASKAQVELAQLEEQLRQKREEAEKLNSVFLVNLN
jgi:hypothetical protein